MCIRRLLKKRDSSQDNVFTWCGSRLDSNLLHTSLNTVQTPLQNAIAGFVIPQMGYKASDAYPSTRLLRDHVIGLNHFVSFYRSCSLSHGRETTTQFSAHPGIRSPRPAVSIAVSNSGFSQLCLALGAVRLRSRKPLLMQSLRVAAEDARWSCTSFTTSV